MTREDAITRLKFIKTFEHGWLGQGKNGIALDMAIAALREQELLAKKQATSDKTSDEKGYE